MIKVKKSKEMTTDPDYDVCSTAEVPAMLHANFESRMVALKWYNLSVMDTVYFDTLRDYLYFQCRCRGGICAGAQECSLYLLGPQLEQGLADRLIYELDEANLGLLMSVLGFQAPKAEEIYLVDCERGLGTFSEAKISDFTCYSKQYRVQRGRSLLDTYRQRWILPGLAPSQENQRLTTMCRIQRKDLLGNEDMAGSTRKFSTWLGLVVGILLAWEGIRLCLDENTADVIELFFRFVGLAVGFVVTSEGTYLYLDENMANSARKSCKWLGLIGGLLLVWSGFRLYLDMKDLF